jgi:mannose/fructose/N-acetylgalactosamine-specific phosphotransferase system component IIC
MKMGQEKFLPLAQETLHLWLNILSKINDPKLQETCYRLFATLSAVLKDDMRHILPTIVEMMLDALKRVGRILVSIGCAICHTWTLTEKSAAALMSWVRNIL